MEVYAGFLEHTDHHVGRLIDALDDLGILEDTLVYYIIGDNGASAEGRSNGTFNELMARRGAAARDDVLASQHRRVWHPDVVQPLAVVGRTRWIRPISGRSKWPPLGRHAERHDRPLAEGSRPGGRSAAVPHVIDVAPTVLEAAGIESLPRSTAYQTPMAGLSMGYAFDDAKAPERRLDAVLRNVLQPWHLRQGLDDVTRH